LVNCLVRKRLGPALLPTETLGTTARIKTHLYPRGAHAAYEERRLIMPSGESAVDVMWRDELDGKPRLDVMNNRFPHAVVWGPLGPLTCCCPFVGHMGIADSQGRIHDFAGPYCIGVDNFMVGCVWRYAKVTNADKDPDWDAALEKADDIYREKVHDICCENCHHHTAVALANTGRPQFGCGGIISTWLLCALHGRCTWWHCLYCD